MTRLSNTQTTLLSAAAANGGRLPPSPDGARMSTQTIDALLKRGFLDERETEDEAAAWRRDPDGHRFVLTITGRGRAVIGAMDAETDANGITEEARPEPEPEERRDRSETKADAAPGAEAAGSVLPRPRGKLGLLLAAVEREEGATLEELSAAAGWLPHTTRAALTRLRQRGSPIRLCEQSGRRAYRIAPEA